MKISAITGLVWLALVATAMGQAKSSSDPASSGAQSKASLSEVRAIVRDLERQTDTLRELLSNHRSLVDQRPDPDESKERHTKWDAALDRLLARVESARATLVDTMQRLDKSITGELPTGLAKDVAKIRNEAEPERAMAEQVLAAKRKPQAASKGKATKPVEKPAEPSNEELDL